MARVIRIEGNEVTIKDGNNEKKFLTSEFVEYPQVGDEVKVIVNGANNIIKKVMPEKLKSEEGQKQEELQIKYKTDNKATNNIKTESHQSNNIVRKILYGIFSFIIPVLGFYWFLKFRNNRPEIAIITFACSVISLIIILSNFYKNTKDITSDYEIDEYDKICYEYCTKEQNYDTGSYSMILNSCVCK